MSLTENAINFKQVEAEIYRFCCKACQMMLKETLERYDKELARGRDRAKYRHKGTRETVIKAIFGEVAYSRAVYEVIGEDGRKSYVYLLDEALGYSGSGFYSELLSEQIARASCGSSYREAARSVSVLTGQTISHTAAWNVVQELGGRVDEQEREAASLATKGEYAGDLEPELLFEEFDGIWLHLQGKSRKDYGKSKEMKLSIAYDGAEKKGKKRYELANKVACANFESSEKFKKRKDGVISKTYNLDEIKMRFVNGDGAGWIKSDITDEATYFQLDQFHRNQAVCRCFSDPDARKGLLKLLYSKQIDLALVVIEAFSNSASDEKEQAKYRALLNYFEENKEGLIPCHRRGLDIPEPPEGKVYRRMGAMESNIFTILGNRMKGRRACWSINGGNNLARLLCLKFTGKLSDALQSLTSRALPERYAEEIEIKMSAAQIPKHEGKGYNGFRQVAIPSSMPWMKDLASLKSLCEI